MSPSERRGPWPPLPPDAPDASDDLAALHRLLGPDLVAELRHLERLRERLHAFDEDPRNAAPIHGLTPYARRGPDRRPASKSQIETAKRVVGLRREDLVIACVAAERATAVQLLQVHRHHERRARDTADDAAQDVAPRGVPGNATA